ncbi:structural maintenance of chromosomes protein 5 [Nematocida sp. AWRm77]|nr:structural maintenance of chromosomes protein 5 [Nematocida sp. AWRm77]
MKRTWVSTLSLKNFQKYKETQFVFAENGNLVIGRNGSGKSTVVAGIVLALGGTSKVLGKVLPVHEYIKHGERKAEAELVLRTTAREELESVLGRKARAPEEGGSVPVSIRRVITAESSVFTVDNEACGVSKVKHLASALGICPESLAQCLPQDRVTEFSTLTEEEQLELTLKTCSPKTLARKKDLEKTDDILEQSTRSAEKHKHDLDEKEKELKQLEEESEKLKALLQRKEQIQHIQGKIKWTEYQELKRAYDAQLLKKKELEGEHGRCAEAYAQKEEAHKGLVELLLQRREHAGSLEHFAEFSSQVCQIRKCEEEMQTVGYRQEVLSKRRAELVQEQASLERLLQRAAETEPPSALFHEQFREELAEIEAQTRAEAIKNSEWQVQSRLKADEIKSLEAAMKAKEMQSTVVLENLKRFHKDTHTAVMLMRESGKNWEVDLPAFLTLKVVREEFAEEVSSQLSFHALTTFVCHSKKAFHAFVQEFKEKHKLSISVTEKQPEGFAPPSPPAIDPQYGMVYLSECIEAPPAVAEFLNLFAKFAFIPVSQESISCEAFFQAYPKTGKVISKKTVYELKSSPYTKQATTVMYPMPKGMGLEHARKSENLEAKLVLLKEERERRASERNAALRVLQVLERREAELKSIKHADDITREKYERAKRSMEINQARVKEIERERKDLEEKEKGERKEAEAIQKREAKAFKKLFPLHFIASFQDLVAHAQAVQTEKEKIRASQEALQKDKEELARLVEEMGRVSTQAQDTERSAKQKRKEAESIVRVETPASKEKMHALPHTIPALTVLLEEEKAKAELTVIDTTAIQAHQLCKKEALAQRALFQRHQEEEKLLRAQKQKEEAEIRKEIETTISCLNTHVHEAFARAKARGTLVVEYADRPRRWALSLQVQFHAEKALEPLSAGRQSGGEKSVSVLLYFLSMQAYARSFFFLVDEVNQGMDAAHERCVHGLLLGEHASQSRQTIIITPKLVPGLEYSETTKVHVIVETP